MRRSAMLRSSLGSSLSGGGATELGIAIGVEVPPMCYKIQVANTFKLIEDINIRILQAYAITTKNLSQLKNYGLGF